MHACACLCMPVGPGASSCAPRTHTVHLSLRIDVQLPEAVPAAITSLPLGHCTGLCHWWCQVVASITSLRLAGRQVEPLISAWPWAHDAAAATAVGRGYPLPQLHAPQHSGQTALLALSTPQHPAQRLPPCTAASTVSLEYAPAPSPEAAPHKGCHSSPSSACHRSHSCSMCSTPRSVLGFHSTPFLKLHDRYAFSMRCTASLA